MKYIKNETKEGAAQSPSPRRAWIEIIESHKYQITYFVALPTEGVD